MRRSVIGAIGIALAVGLLAPTGALAPAFADSVEPDAEVDTDTDTPTPVADDLGGFVQIPGTNTYQYVFEGLEGVVEEAGDWGYGYHPQVEDEVTIPAGAQKLSAVLIGTGGDADKWNTYPKLQSTRGFNQGIPTGAGGGAGGVAYWQHSGELSSQTELNLYIGGNAVIGDTDWNTLAQTGDPYDPDNTPTSQVLGCFGRVPGTEENNYPSSYFFTRQESDGFFSGNGLPGGTVSVIDRSQMLDRWCETWLDAAPPGPYLEAPQGL